MLDVFAQKFLKLAEKINPISSWVGIIAAVTFISGLFASWSNNAYSKFIAEHSFVFTLIMMWTGWCWLIWYIYFPRKLELVDNDFIKTSEYEKLSQKEKKFYTRNYILYLFLLILFSLLEVVLVIKEQLTSK